MAYDYGISADTTSTWQIFSPTTGSNWSMTHPFICTYLMTDGSRYTDKPGYETNEFREVFADRDKRLSATVLGPITRNGKWCDDSDFSNAQCNQERLSDD